MHYLYAFNISHKGKYKMTYHLYFNGELAGLAPTCR